MAIELASEMSEAELLYQYLGRRLSKGKIKLTLDELMA
jgi:hypothetical protein